MPDVYVTGLGAITPAGDLDRTWQGLLQGRSFIRTFQGLDLTGCRVDFGGQVRHFVPPAGTNGLDRCVQFAVSAARQAIDHAGLTLQRLAQEGPTVVVGSSKGCILSLLHAHATWLRQATRPPNLLGQLDPSAPARQLARTLGISGPHTGIVAACATGLHALIHATQLIQDGTADLVLAGATDAAIHPLLIACFQRMGVLASANATPATACRPFDATRCGFVVAEGAAMFVLESADHALARSARPLARIAAYARAADPTDLVRPDPQGQALASAIRLALHRAALAPADLDYVSAHGTGTRDGDLAETRALHAALGKAARQVPVSSVKGALGHMLGAAGAVEAALAIRAIHSHLVPPTVNLTTPDPYCDLDYTAGQARARQVRRVLCVSVGFGGHLAALIVDRPPGAT